MPPESELGSIDYSLVQKSVVAIVAFRDAKPVTIVVRRWAAESEASQLEEARQAALVWAPVAGWEAQMAMQNVAAEAEEGSSAQVAANFESAEED